MITSLILAFSLMTGMPGSIETDLNRAAADSVDGNFKVLTEDLFKPAGRNIISTDWLSLKFHDRFDGFYGAQPDFSVDGLPADATFFGVIHPQYLPIVLGKIKSIRHDDASDFGYGKTYSSGQIVIESSPIDNGLSFFGSGMILNEAGEPGPWVYDSNRVSPNKERFGPSVDLASAYKSGNWFGKGLFRYHRHLNSDLSIQARMKNMLGFPETGEFLSVDAETYTGMIEGGYKSDQLKIRARAIHADSEEFLFFQPLGREVPTEIGMGQYTLAADGEIDPLWGVSTYIQVQNKTLDYRRNVFGHNFDWSEEIRAFHVSMNRSAQTNYLEFGSRLRLIYTSAPGIKNMRRGYTDLFVNTETEMTQSMSFLSGHNIVINSESAAIQSKAGFLIELSNRWSTEISVNYSETLPEFSNTSDFWTIQGSSLYEHLGISYRVPSAIEKNRRFSIHVDQEFRLSSAFTFGVDLAHISQLSFHIPFQEVEYDLDFHTFPGLYTLFENQTGTRLDGEVNMSHTLSATFEHDLTVYFNRTVSGSSQYLSYWKTVPNFLMNYIASWQPFPDLELQSKISYRTISEWKEFGALDGEQFRNFNPQVPFAFGTFSSKTPAILKIDLQVAKWFWEQRFRTIIMLKNILNKEDYSHPLAARQGFTFVLKGEFRF